jgi:UDP-N-acetylglucosamine 2-epimerase (hydrolysing)
MKKILFLTGTRADYGKLKPLISGVFDNPLFECHLFVTGMHTLQEFGDTKSEIYNDFNRNVHIYMNQISEEPMDLVLANTINGFSRFIRELLPDLIVIHGDRVEALACSISGALNNVLVAHIEGGEISGTIDESIRHAISKLAHVHFVSNEKAKDRLIQLGENSKSIFVIGSPDIDLILKPSPITIHEVLNRYDITFENYAIVMYHPVTTEQHFLKNNIKNLVDAVINSKSNFIVVNPNNDEGHNVILNEFERFQGLSYIKRFPSIRFEFFIELLKHANFILGNSSAGIHEAPVIGIPTINVGSRQNNRFTHESIFNVSHSYSDIYDQVIKFSTKTRFNGTLHFGVGSSKENFMKIIENPDFWNTPRQKVFYDFKM